MSNDTPPADQGALLHRIIIALTLPPAPEIDAGTDITLKVKVSCPHGCDLRGQPVNVIAADGSMAGASPLAEFAEAVNGTPEFAFKAPDEVGDHSWTVVFPRHEAEGVVHEEAFLPITVRTIPHDTSLAVWGIASPIVMNHAFRIHVGATCSSGCNLTGKEIQICDEAGASVASGRLGDTPFDGTRALYWTEFELVAPGREGAASRSVTFAPAELKLPHGAASARFGFETVRPPQHSVTVKVVEKDAGTPIEDAQVRLGVYFAYSDTTGIARIAVPQGRYSLDVLKTGYESTSRVVEANHDVTVEVEATIVPPENPDAYWLFDPTKHI